MRLDVHLNLANDRFKFDRLLQSFSCHTARPGDVTCVMGQWWSREGVCNTQSTTVLFFLER